MIKFSSVELYLLIKGKLQMIQHKMYLINYFSSFFLELNRKKNENFYFVI